ncbi:MAG: hypothetical protein D3913_08125 [Candidatus Electrothrix sp. LOE1_4_5]|nr:hypothetical protein [Candidatus Electrothrix gigas]MCI5178112.1 hypothetical protein [Candidatus Electrothrix gigas]
MGTSTSSSGPGKDVPFDPPWLDPLVEEIENPSEQTPEESDEENETQAEEDQSQPVEIAPHGRFGSARRYLGEYLQSGDENSLVKSLGSYSRKGMGGAANLSRRMRASTSVGAGLFNFLQDVRDGSTPKVQEWIHQLSAQNLSAQELTDEIIEQVLSTGGSLDEESCRDSMSQAMSDLLIRYPDVDLLKMNDDSIWTVMEFFIANEALNRIFLDIGQVFESARVSPQEAVFRMNDMREYLKAEVSAQLQEVRKNTKAATTAELNNILQSALRITFEIFEGEI